MFQCETYYCLAICKTGQACHLWAFSRSLHISILEVQEICGKIVDLLEISDLLSQAHGTNALKSPPALVLRLPTILSMKMFEEKPRRSSATLLEQGPPNAFPMNLMTLHGHPNVHAWVTKAWVEFMLNSVKC